MAIITGASKGSSSNPTDNICLLVQVHGHHNFESCANVKTWLTQKVWQQRKGEREKDRRGEREIERGRKGEGQKGRKGD